MVILHHYDFSNYAEKVRLVLGWKQFAWRSVEIPATAPKPDYTPLTAGYRRTPALQIGADVYCDTQLIVDVLDAATPTPSIYPGGAVGRARQLALVAWAETALFRPLALYITGLHAARFDQHFHRDRAHLHGKPEPDVARVMAAAPRYQAQVEGQLARLEDLLDHDQPWVLGDAPGLADFALYMAPWFLELIGGPSALLDRQPRTRAWMARVAAIGHGSLTPCSAEEALAEARASTPQPLPAAPVMPCPEGLMPGDDVEVSPLDERSPACGRLLRVDGERITLATTDTRSGSLHVHFPRLGYRLAPARRVAGTAGAERS